MKLLNASFALAATTVLMCVSPQAASAAEPPSDSTILDPVWKDAFRLGSADGKLVFSPIGVAQPMFVAHVDPDSTPAYEGSGFVLRRMAIGFDARLYGRVRAFLAANLARGNTALWDYFVDVTLVPDWLVLRAGRFRPWLARHRLVAAHMYQLPELAVAMTEVLEVGDGRDLGAGLFGVVLGHLEYGLGAWNGEQSFSLEGPGVVAGKRIPANTDFEVGGRLVVHPFEVLSVADEPDLSGAPEPRLALGGGAMYNRRRGLSLPLDPADLTSVAAYRDQTLKLGAEAAFKMSGLSIIAELFARRAWLLEEEDAAVRTVFLAQGRGQWGLGAYGQAGYFLVPRRFEAVLRFDYADKQRETPGYGLYPSAGCSYSFFGYHLRAQLMYRLGLRLDQVDEQGAQLDPLHDLFFMLQASI